MFAIRYYNNQIPKFIQSLDLSQQGKILDLIEELSQRGNFLDEVHSKTRCDHIFKLRIKSPKHSIRIFYAFDKDLFILHGYVKKDQKTRNKELTLATKRYKEMKEIYK